MNLSLIIQKTIKRFIGKVISRLTKPKKQPPAEPIIPPVITTIPRPEIPESPSTPPVVFQPAPVQYPSSPPPRTAPGLAFQNPLVSFFTRLRRSPFGRATGAVTKRIAVGRIALKLTKAKKAAVSPPETPKISPTPQIISQPEPPRPQPSPSPRYQNPALSVVTSLGKVVIRKTIEAGSKKIAVGRLFGGIASRAPGFLSGAAGTVGSLFSGLTAASLPAVLPLVGVIAALGAVVLITLITVMTVGGAFQKGQGGQAANFGTPVVAQAPSPASQLGETVIWTLNQCGVTAVNRSTWTRTEDCLHASSLPNKEIIIAQFRFSVFEVGPGLQCVGFVRGVMAASGKDPGDGRDAKDYLNPPPPAGYQPVNTKMNEVKVGDLVIMRGSNDGHIAVVIGKGVDSIRIAQAWGTSGGAIQVTEVNPAYFDGFLRPL